MGFDAFEVVVAQVDELLDLQVFAELSASAADVLKVKRNYNNEGCIVDSQLHFLPVRTSHRVSSSASY